jgi:hypothetical protein
LPPLPQPKGMQSSRTGSSSSGNEFSARTRLTGGALGTAAVLTHYTCLLVAAGWTTTPPAAADSIAAQGLRARDKDGKTWTGWLVVSLEGSTRDVSLSMRRSESQ